MAPFRQTTFGQLLKRYRRAAHLTQETLAERVGYSPDYMSMLERGVRLPAPATIDLLARALELNASDQAALQAAAQDPETPRTAAISPQLSTVHLIGREAEAAAVVSLLQQENVRLLTLIGPGGVGKTRLAQDAAAMLGHRFSDGSLFVDLAVVSDPERVPLTIAQGLKLREARDKLIRDRLIGRLRKKEILLFLDSMERVIEAAPFLSELLRECPRLKILGTSRSPLRLREEREFSVQPLTFPAFSSALTTTDLLQYSAVALFLQRTKLIKPDFQNDVESLRLIADICQRLDGLPLAIELAAARIKHLSLPELYKQSVHRLQILTGGPRDMPQRQQRMWDTIAWSYDMLGPAEQRILRYLSSFVGSWSLQAAQFMCAEQFGHHNLLDALRTLVDDSLVILSEARYRMLDTIREFSQQQLILSGEAQLVQRRHADYYLHFTQPAGSALEGGELGDWHRRLETEEENIRAALDWLMQNKEIELALRLAISIWRYWQRQGNLGEGRRWLEGGLAKGQDLPDEVRGNALWAAIWLAHHQGDYARADEASREYLTLARKIADPLAMRNALTGLGESAIAQGRYIEGLAFLRESLEICRKHGKNWHLGTSLLNLGRALMYLGDNQEAVSLLEEALDVYQDLGNRSFVTRTIAYLGYAALLRGDYPTAEQLFRQSLSEFYDIHETMGVAEGLESLAAVFAVTGRAEQTARLAAAAGVIRETIAAQPLPFDRDTFQDYVRRAREQLSPQVWASAWAEGSKMSAESATDLALQQSSHE